MSYKGKSLITEVLIRNVPAFCNSYDKADQKRAEKVCYQCENWELRFNQNQADCITAARSYCTAQGYEYKGHF